MIDKDSKIVRFETENFHREYGGEYVDDYQFEFGIGAKLNIYVGSKLLFNDDFTTVSELAIQLAQWQDIPRKKRPDFLYDAIDNDEPEMLWIRGIGDGWQIGSQYQEYEETTLFTIENVEQAITNFIGEVIQSSKKELNLDLSKYIK